MPLITSKSGPNAALKRQEELHSQSLAAGYGHILSQHDVKDRKIGELMRNSIRSGGSTEVYARQNSRTSEGLASKRYSHHSHHTASSPAMSFTEKVLSGSGHSEKRTSEKRMSGTTVAENASTHTGHAWTEDAHHVPEAMTVIEVAEIGHHAEPLPKQKLQKTKSKVEEQLEEVTQSVLTFNAWAEGVLCNVVGPPDIQEDREQKLNKVIGFAILLNTIAMGLEIDLAPRGGNLQDRLFWFVLESVFIALFAGEIVVRMCWERSRWPFVFWNWLDFMVVSVAILETWVLNLLQESGDSPNLSMLTLLRIVRLVRLIRVVRLVRMFRALYVTVMAFKEAVSSIFYICTLMCAGLYLCSIFTTSTIGRNETLANLNMGGYSGADRFGTIPRSMYSLFELMTLEGWEQVGRPLVMAEPLMAVFLFMFIMIFTFGLLNMIVAMVVEKTLQEARKTNEISEHDLFAGVEQGLKNLRQAFSACDLDKSGRITKEEFAVAVKDNLVIKSILEELNIPSDNALVLFSVLDADGSGELTLSEILEGCARIKGANDPEWDLLATHATLRTLVKKVDSLEERLCEDFAHHPHKVPTSIVNGNDGMRAVGSTCDAHPLAPEERLPEESAQRSRAQSPGQASLAHSSSLASLAPAPDAASVGSPRSMYQRRPESPFDAIGTSWRSSSAPAGAVRPRRPFPEYLPWPPPCTQAPAPPDPSVGAQLVRLAERQEEIRKEVLQRIDREAAAREAMQEKILMHLQALSQAR